jgi:hypothetical protein
LTPCIATAPAARAQAGHAAQPGSERDACGRLLDLGEEAVQMAARVREVEARGSCVGEPEQGRANLGTAGGPADQPFVEPGAGPDPNPHALLEAGTDLANRALQGR